MLLPLWAQRTCRYTFIPSESKELASYEQEVNFPAAVGDLTVVLLLTRKSMVLSLLQKESSLRATITAYPSGLGRMPRKLLTRGRHRISDYWILELP